MDYRIMEDGESKCLASEEYNYAFNKRTGFFARWGRTLEDDPQWSPFGPEILDLEISAGECSGRWQCSGRWRWWGQRTW